MSFPYRSKHVALISIALVILVGLSITACNHQPPQPTFTVGVVNFTPVLEPVFEGFKAGMTEFNYIEGKNITYLYDGPVTSINALKPAVQNLLDQGVDMILSITTPASLNAKKAVAGTDTPVIFAPVTEPEKSGLVESLSKPGGNLTGIRGGGFIPKQLEWLLKISPTAKRILVPHNPDDNASIQSLKALRAAAAELGTDLTVLEVRKPQEVVAALEALPEDLDAVILVPDGLALSQIDRFVAATRERKLALSAQNLKAAKAGALVTYGPNTYAMGKQAARLADQVLRGIAPADIPVETAEFFLTLNLKTAKAIDLQLPDQVLVAAHHIIR